MRDKTKNHTPITNHRSRRHWLGAALVIILVPLLLLALPFPPAKGKWAVHKKDWVTIAAAVIAAVSLGFYFIRTSIFARRSLLALILCGTSLLVLANVGWNASFRHYYEHHRSYKREVFRPAMHNLWAPVYGRYDNAIARFDPAIGGYSFATLPFVGLSILIAAGWFFWSMRRPMEKPWGAGALTILVAFQIALILAFALCEPWPSRLSLHISGYAEFAKDLHRFKGVGDILRHYVARMPTLEWYGQHYPPGNLILLKIEKEMHLVGLTKALVVLATALSAVVVNRLAVELELGATAVSLATLLFAGSTGVLIYCTINTTSLVLLPATICLWCLARGLRRGSIIAGALLGLSFLVYLFFSFSAAIFGILMAIIVAIAWGRGAIAWRNLLKTAVVSSIVLLGGIGLLAAVTHFNLVACFQAAVHGHHAQQGNEGFDDVHRYLLRSTGNILAYLLSTTPLCILLVLSLFRRVDGGARLGKAFFIAAAATILIAGFSGLFYIETERIWIFFTPVLALAAGDELSRPSEQESSSLARVVWLLVLVISCAQEFFMLHYR